MAGSSDFTIHNPTNANQEPDGSFAADPLTTGGISLDAIMPSPWMNARWYEDSVGLWAFMKAMANKGYVISKDNAATLAATLTSALVTNADLKPPLVSVAFSPTPVFPASTSNGFDLILSGNVTSSTFDSVPNIGQTLTFVITQGATPFTFVPPTSINGWKPIDTTPNSVTVQQFIVKMDGTIWPLVVIRAVQNSLFGLRTFGVIYQNATGSPMEVMATGQLNLGVGHNSSIQLLIGKTSGSLVNPGRINGIANGPGYASVSGIVPDGSFYQVNTSIAPSDTNPMTLVAWEETPLIIN